MVFFFFLSVLDHYVGTGFVGSRCTKHPEKNLGLVLVIKEAAGSQTSSCMLRGSTRSFCPSGVGLASWMLPGGMCVCSQSRSRAAAEV